MVNRFNVCLGSFHIGNQLYNKPMGSTRRNRCNLYRIFPHTHIRAFYVTLHRDRHYRRDNNSTPYQKEFL